MDQLLAGVVRTDAIDVPHNRNCGVIPRFADNLTLGCLRRVLSRLFFTTLAGHGTTLEHHEEDLQCVDPRGAGNGAPELERSQHLRARPGRRHPSEWERSQCGKANFEDRVTCGLCGRQ